LAEGLPVGDYFLSVISEIELLSFPDLTAQQEQALRDLLADLTIVTIDQGIRDAAIHLRREHRLRIPDAVIAATALTLGAELLTNDAKLAQTPGLTCRPLALKTP
jgi:hypothetical protein